MPAIERLPDLEIPGHAPSQPNGADHPMRVMTRRAAGLEGPPWDAAARAEVAALFDELAPQWHTRNSPERARVVLDALERGEVGPGGTALELGSGTGTYTAMLAERFSTVVTAELSLEMLRLARGEPGQRVLADAHDVPVAGASADAVVLVNMMLFPAEVERVLAPGGCVVWVSSSGEATPIHLLPDEVARALPGSWTGTWARTGSGIWTVLRRA